MSCVSYDAIFIYIIKDILKNNLEFGKGKDDFNYWYLNSLFYLAYKNTKLRLDKPFSIKIGQFFNFQSN